MTYCEYLNTIRGENLSLHKEYHDNHYGFPIEKDDEILERRAQAIFLALIALSVRYIIG